MPVLGVPVASKHLQGVDSLHSIVQMPKGIPVATFAIGAAGAANAALFAVAMLATGDAALRAKLDAFRARYEALAAAARSRSAAVSYWLWRVQLSMVSGTSASPRLRPRCFALNAFTASRRAR